jgi:metallo-beta-lactamase class B
VACEVFFLTSSEADGFLFHEGFASFKLPSKTSVSSTGIDKLAYLALLSLGDTKLTAHLHPGHTKGATSFTAEIRENGKTYRVVIANMGSINPGVTVTGMATYPGIQQDYARTFAAQQAMKIDVFLSSHASQFGMHEKFKPGDAYNPDRFVDPKGFQEAVRRLEKTYLDQVAKERAGK